MESNKVLIKTNQLNKKTRPGKAGRGQVRESEVSWKTMVEVVGMEVGMVVKVMREKRMLREEVVEDGGDGGGDADSFARS